MHVRGAACAVYLCRLCRCVPRGRERQDFPAPHSRFDPTAYDPRSKTICVQCAALLRSGEVGGAANGRKRQMARRNHKWSLYRREESAVWWVRFYINGKPVRRSTGEEDEGKAEVEAGKLWVEENTRAGKPVSVELRTELARLTVEDAAASWLIWLNDHKDEHRDQWVSRYEADLCYLVPKSPEEIAALKAKRPKDPIWQPPWTYADEISTVLWERVKLDLHKPKGPLGWNSIRHLGITLKALLRFACTELGAIESVPELAPPKLKLIRKEKRKRRAFTLEQREAFLTALREYRVVVD